MAKPAFDPSQPFESAANSPSAQAPIAKPAFDPSKPFDSGPSVMQAMGRGAVQGATLGFGDEMQGAAEAGTKGSLAENLPDVLKIPYAASPLGMSDAIGGKIAEMLTGNKKVSDLVDEYKQARDETRANNKAARNAHPLAYGAGEIAGGLVTAPLMPGGAAKTIGGAVRAGALYGAASGLGNSDAEDVGGMAADTAKGAALGGTIGAVTHVAAPLIEAGATKVGNSLKDLAENQAFKSSGAMLKDFRTVKDAKAAGRWMLDDMGLQAGDSVKDIANKSSAALEDAGQNLDNVYAKAQEKFSDAINKVGFDPKRDKDAILAGVRKDLGITEGADEAVARLGRYFDMISRNHGDAPNEAALDKFKREVADYLPKFRNYLSARADYIRSVGQAGADSSQGVLPGIVDDLQRTGVRPNQIELLGKDAQTAGAAFPAPTQQMSLPDLPDRGSVAEKYFGTVNDKVVDPFGRLAPQNAVDAVVPGEQLDFLNNNSKDMISTVGKQGEFQGLDLTPRSYAQVEQPVVNQGMGQTRMAIPPGEAPARPIRPDDVRNPMTPRQTNNVKTEIDNVINYARNPQSKQPATEAAFASARKQISQRVDEAIQNLGGDKLLEELKAANRDYGTAKTINRIADDRVSREAAKMTLGLTDHLAAGAVATAGHAEAGPATAALAMAGAIGSKLVRKYGSTTIAVASDRASKFLLQSPAMQELAQTNQPAFRAAVFDLTERMMQRSESRAAGGALQAVPKAADQQQPKGPDKWAADGFSKLQKMSDGASLDRDRLMSDPKMKALLIQASDLTPGSKAMANVLAQIKARSASDINVRAARGAR